MARDPYKYFRLEARELCEKLNQDTLDLERQPEVELVSRLLRHAHTLKGAARVVKQPGIADCMHRLEGHLAPYRESVDGMPADLAGALFQLLDETGVLLARLDAPPDEVPEAAPRLAPQPAAPTPPPLPDARLEVDGLLEDLRAANNQVEVLRRNLAQLERGKLLSEMLLAQLPLEQAGKGPRYLAEELQTQLRTVERSLAFGVDQLERDLHQVRESTESLRLVRADSLYPTLRRAARDAAQELNKQVELEMVGGDMRLEAPLLGRVLGALIQMLRNSLAHGLEAPEERRAAGKEPTGRLRLTVQRQGRSVEFRLRDDGRGVDFPALRRALAARGLPELDEPALLAQLLQGGLSTSQQVTQAAGRGIGMDIVRETAGALGGQAHIETEAGRFTEVVLELPLSVSALEFLVLEVGQTRALIPLESVRAAIRLEADMITRGDRGDSVVHEGAATRLLYLAPLLGEREGTARLAALVRTRAGPRALAVERLDRILTATLLPLPAWARASRVVVGAALDADGDPQLVLDPDGLESLEQVAAAPPAPASESATILVIDDSLTTRMLQQSILESAGYRVELASSAEEGLARLREEPFGLILVDVEMPGQDGFGFLETIRADERLRHIPALLVTSRDAPEDRRRGEAVGAQGYVVKSQYDQKDLLRRIRGFLHE